MHGDLKRIARFFEILNAMSGSYRRNDSIADKNCTVFNQSKIVES